MGSNDDATWAGSRRLKTLANHFSNQKQPQAAAAGFAKRAAVLVCLFPGDDGNLRVILTKRASTLSSYSGEVSLPGGKMDEGDADCVDTALREAKEEIGLDPSQVLVVTTLDPFIAKGDVLVVPVIGLLRDKRAFNPIPNTAEVEAVFDAPLDLFLKDENRRAEEKEWKGEEFICNFFDYECHNKKYVIWALTAVILITSASLVYQRPPDFSERRPKIWSSDAVKLSQTGP
ncbi:nudix hydrolase 15, mitochondrial-like isoform X1 [Humulus lupulus]|uniref:nudix hydrolase 15, mitochondrial-like isoform X1 n=1 Tax=Humulus lupulus TaxID=3486 RepID=UPI002B405E63|nr:nudix hydrolase 15, mitochondrial-like isoform X1 [Humulus lupulus]